MKKKQLYIDAIHKWGPKSQIYMAIEEMAELTHVLAKKLRKGGLCALTGFTPDGEVYQDWKPDNLDMSFLDEMADGEIMLETLCELYHCRRHINKFKKKKLLYLQKLLENDHATHTY